MAAALGVPGAATPADLAAAGRRSRRRGGHHPRARWSGGRAAPAVAELADALAATAPGLTVLVTSRVPIGADGEVPVLLEPLGLGTADGPAPAVELFIARSGLSAEQLSDDELDTVTRICERAAGLPLALELAAADVHAGDLTPVHDRTDGPRSTRSARRSRGRWMRCPRPAAPCSRWRRSSPTASRWTRSPRSAGRRPARLGG